MVFHEAERDNEVRPALGITLDFVPNSDQGVSFALNLD